MKIKFKKTTTKKTTKQPKHKSTTVSVKMSTNNTETEEFYS